MPRFRTFAELPTGTKFRFAGKILIKRNRQIAKDENNHDYIFAGESESLTVEPFPPNGTEGDNRIIEGSWSI